MLSVEIVAIVTHVMLYNVIYTVMDAQCTLWSCICSSISSRSSVKTYVRLRWFSVHSLPLAYLTLHYQGFWVYLVIRVSSDGTLSQGSSLNVLLFCYNTSTTANVISLVRLFPVCHSIHLLY